MILNESNIINKKKYEYDISEIHSKEELNYDRFSEMITDAFTKAIIKSKEYEKEQEAKAEEKEILKWHEKIGIKEHSDNENFIKRNWIELYNSLVALKTIILYKKDYAESTNFSFGLMALISSGIFSLLSLAFLILGISLILYLIFYENNPWLYFVIVFLFFISRIMHIIKLEIEAIDNSERINMIFGSLMAFIAALFTVLSFLLG